MSGGRRIATNLSRSAPSLGSSSGRTPVVRFSYAEPSDPALKRFAVRSIELATGQPKLRRLYRKYDGREDFFDAAVRLLRLDVRCDLEQLARIPKSGPLVVVANHPFGVVDGIAISHLISKVRDDYRIIAHGLLTRAPEAAERILPIDFSTKREALHTNLATRREAISWLNDGHVLLIFPAGGVAMAKHPFGQAIDFRWRPFTAKLIHGAKAPVLPMYTAGQNSRVYQVASHYSETIRSALLFFEVRNKIGRPIQITIGETVDYKDLEQFKDRQALMDWLYSHVYALGRRDVQPGAFVDAIVTPPRAA